MLLNKTAGFCTQLSNLLPNHEEQNQKLIINSVLKYKITLRNLVTERSYLKVVIY